MGIRVYLYKIHVSLFVTNNMALPCPFLSDLTDGSTVMKHMVFGVVTAIDLLNFVTAREKRERSISECTDDL